MEKAKTKFLSKINWVKVLEFSLPAIATILIYLLSMIIKGVAPFGKNSFGYIDYNDGLVPAYTALWDLLHGRANATVSWNLGAGGYFYTSAITNSFLSPLCWLIAIFPRESILFSIVFIVIISLALMATTAYICFKKYFPNMNKYVLLLFSLIWTFSGWMLIHYTNIGWLNIMILLPLLLISAKQLVSDGKIFWFVIILTYMLLLSYYITFMVLVGVVVISTLYICILAKEKKKVASNLFFATIISILISMFAFIPTCVTSLQAHRFSEPTSSFPTAELYDHFFSKLAILIMHALPVVLFVRLLFTYKKDKKNVLFFMLAFIICSVGLIIEPINKMWHTGSYFCFPFRYSFVIIMLMIFGSLYYLNKYFTPSPENQNQEVSDPTKNLSKSNVETTQKIENNEPEISKSKKQLKEENTSEKTTPQSSKKKSYINWVEILMFTFAGISLIATLILGLTGAMLNVYRAINFKVFIPFALLFASTYLFIELALRCKSKKIAWGKIPGGILIFIICIIQIIGLNTGYCGMQGGSNNQNVTNALEVSTENLDHGYKIKDRENLLNVNFPYFINYPSLSTWIHISSEDQFVGYNNLGYNTLSTILYSSGGTYITDVLLGNKYVLSQQELNSTYHTYLDSFDYINETTGEKQQIHLYESNLNFNLVYTTNTDLTKLISSNNWFENHNTLYKVLYNQSEDIITSIPYSIVEIEENKYKITISSIANQNIYLQNKLDKAVAITQNDFRSLAYNGLYDLGIAENSTMEIIIEANADLNTVKENLSFGAFNIEKFASVHNAISTNDSTLKLNKNIDVTLTNTENHKYALIPYTYLNNTSATVNGKDATVSKAFNNFIFVEIENGENQITVNHEPQLFKICLIATIVGILLFIAFTLLNKYFKLSNKKPIIWIGFVGACLILLTIAVVIYAKPFVEFFVILFS